MPSTALGSEPPGLPPGAVLGGWCVRSGEEGSGPGGTYQAPAVGSGGSALPLAGSSSVLRRKDGHTCTCLSTLLLISSKVDMAGDLWAEHPALLSPVVTSGATLSSDRGVTWNSEVPTAGAMGSNPPKAADLLSPSPAPPQVRAPQTRMIRTELVSGYTQKGATRPRPHSSLAMKNSRAPG